MVEKADYSDLNLNLQLIICLRTSNQKNDRNVKMSIDVCVDDDGGHVCSSHSRVIRAGKLQYNLGLLLNPHMLIRLISGLLYSSKYFTKNRLT